MDLTIGITGRADTIANDTNTAEAIGSGSLRVFGTPFMIALMEKASCNSLQEALEPGKSSVGVYINVQHTSATPVGAHVYAESTVTAIDGKKITFRVTAYDDAGEIGSGEHARVIIDSSRFMERCISKHIKKDSD
jgi:Predicted thioesterase